MKWVALSACLSIGLLSPAIASAALEGVVRDQKSGAPLPGVSVYVIETGDVAITDENGRFLFPDLPAGTFKVAVIDPAYEKSEINVTTEEGAQTSVEIALSSNLVQSEEVVVDVARSRPAAGSMSLVREEVTKVPGTRGDMLTAVKSLPGVANTGTFGPEAGGIIIRGSNPADSKVLVDGFEIPILYHFQSLQSVLPSELIDDLTYLPGGFGVENGRATGGVVEVTSRKTPRDWGGFAEVSFINGGVYADGPIGEQGGFVLAARRSIIDAVLPLVIPDSASLSFNALPVYYDY